MFDQQAISLSRVSGYSRLYHDIVASLLPQRTRLAIACDAGVDDAWVNLRDALVVHAVLLECIGQIVLDQYITLLDKLVQNVDAGFVLEREPEGLLVAVDLIDVRACIKTRQSRVNIQRESRHSLRSPPCHYLSCKRHRVVPKLGCHRLV